MFVMQRISTTALTEIVGRLPEIMRIGGAYYMFISRPSLMNVLYAVYEKMAENLDDESYYGTALYFVLRGILKMHSVQMEDE